MDKGQYSVVLLTDRSRTNGAFILSLREFLELPARRPLLGVHMKCFRFSSFRVPSVFGVTGSAVPAEKPSRNRD